MRRRAGVAYIVASAVCFGAMAIMARFAYATGVDTVRVALRHRRGNSFCDRARARRRVAARQDAGNARRAGSARLWRPGGALFSLPDALARRVGFVAPR